MTSLIQILSTILLLIYLSTTQANDAKIALVIGNKDYAFSPLKNPINDARDMRDKLQSLGFDVIYRENASLQSMETAIEEFGNQLKSRQVGLFYYSGHGAQYEGENYLIPVDMRGLSETSLKYKSLNVGLLLDTMKQATTSASQPASQPVLSSSMLVVTTHLKVSALTATAA